MALLSTEWRPNAAAFMQFLCFFMAAKGNADVFIE
jgi:hypothetical protein